MVTNYYNASNNFSAPIRREPKPFRPHPIEHEHACKEVDEQKQLLKGRGFLDEIDADSLLIIGLVLLLLFSGCEDKLLLVALGYLLLF